MPSFSELLRTHGVVKAPSNSGGDKSAETPPSPTTGKSDMTTAPPQIVLGEPELRAIGAYSRETPDTRPFLTFLRKVGMERIAHAETEKALEAERRALAQARLEVMRLRRQLKHTEQRLRSAHGRLRAATQES